MDERITMHMHSAMAVMFAYLPLLLQHVLG